MSSRGHFTKTNISPGATEGGGKGTGGSCPFPCRPSSVAHVRGSFGDSKLSARWPPTLRVRPSQPTCMGCDTAGKLLLSIIFNIYYYSVPMLILIYRPTEGGRLSRPRHCSKGTQPMPKAVCIYNAVAVVINTRQH